MCHSVSSAVNDEVNLPLVRSAAVSAAPYKPSERPISVPRSSSLPFRDPFSTPFSIPTPRLHPETLSHSYPQKIAACTMKSRDFSVQREKNQFGTFWPIPESLWFLSLGQTMLIWSLATTSISKLVPLNAQMTQEDSLRSSRHDDRSKDNGVYGPLTPASSDVALEDLPKDDSSPAPSTELCLEEGKTGDRCFFMSDCILQSPERKTISHFFGRNKACTQAIPNTVWVPYCRRHYQRSRYRNITKFANVQLELIRIVVNNFETWGGVENFEVILRKRAAQAMAREDKLHKELQPGGRTDPHEGQSTTWKERWLVPYLGKNKSFEDVYKILDRIDAFAQEHNLENPPEFEILPSYKPGWIRNEELPKTSVAQAAKPTGIAKRSTSKNRHSRHKPSISGPTISTSVLMAHSGCGSVSSGRAVEKMYTSRVASGRS